MKDPTDNTDMCLMCLLTQATDTACSLLLTDVHLCMLYDAKLYSYMTILPTLIQRIC